MKFFLLILCFLAIALRGQAQRYQQLHRQALVVDTHNDVLYAAIMPGLRLADDLTGKAHSDFKRFRQGGVDAQVFAVWCDETYGPGKAFQYANQEIDSLYAIAARHPDKMTLVKTPAALKQVVAQNKLAALIGVEGGHMIEDNLAYLDHLYRRGVRYLTLTWNNSTAWASSSAEESSNKVPVAARGLNGFGKTVVKRMNALGMMIDVSHVGEQTLRDVLATTTKPVLASHSSVYAISPHHRNLKDDQIRAIAKNGGVIQVNFASNFLDPTFARRSQAFAAAHQNEIDSLQNLKKKEWEIGAYFNQKYPHETQTLRPPLSALLDHIDYIVKLVGVDYVGLGSDFDGIPSSPRGLEDVAQFPNITRGLLARGYREKDIEKILGGNFMRVFAANTP